jgi:hypothetical protein
MVMFEVWYLLGNIPGFVGLCYYLHGRTNKALLLFIVFGTLHCYNATIYLAMCWYVHNLETVLWLFHLVGPQRMLDMIVRCCGLIIVRETHESN